VWTGDDDAAILDQQCGVLDDPEFAKFPSNARVRRPG
jgi:hypothetical protein